MDRQGFFSWRKPCRVIFFNLKHLSGNLESRQQGNSSAPGRRSGALATFEPLFSADQINQIRELFGKKIHQVIHGNDPFQAAG